MSYNLTTISNNATSILGFSQGVNDQLMFGWLGISFLIGISIILFSSWMYVTNDVQKSVAATGFASFLLCVLLTAMGLIRNPLVIFISLTIAGVSLAFSWRRN